MSKLEPQDILDFEQAQIALAKDKKIELELRKKIIGHFRYGTNVEGVQHKSLEGLDIDILITLGLKRKVDEDGINTIWADLTQEQRDCIKYKPTVDVKAYKELLANGEAGELINVIIETPSLASVKLKYEE